MNHKEPRDVFRVTRFLVPTFLIVLLSACGPPVEDCGTAGDEDGNGLSDCQDPACSAVPACAPETDCQDNVDNDGDGTTDCQDFDCANNPACLPEVNCNDNVDNDLDGDIDCADDDCQGTAACVESDCRDGQDNDLDGDIDCADSDCAADVTCNPEGNCQDGQDNDLDGQTDCADSDCFNDPICTALCGNGTIDVNEQCDDGNNADGDGCSSFCQIEFCGDGVINNNGTEQCDPPDGIACDDLCQRIPICGDGFIDPPEQCEDGNTENGDGCDENCLVEAEQEVEPNDDGTPDVGAGFPGINGNDFDSANANGPFSEDTIIFATISPAGDEDVFAVSNTGADPVAVQLDTFNVALGIGVPCGTTIDTAMHVRNAAGTSLASNDDRNGVNDRCSTLSFTIQPGETVFAHVSDFNDDNEIAAPGYFLVIDFPVCGDGSIDPGEDCDPPDGVTCDDFCQKIPVCGDGFLDPGEECDPPDGTTCDDQCQRVPVCGDGFLDGTEECDDGNLIDGDFCSSVCTLEAGAILEIEPNEDGTPQTGGSGINGNDFDSANANGPFSEDAIILASINPTGDEDVFAVTNPGSVPVTVQLDVFNPALGIGVPCGTTIDTAMHVRNAAGTSLASNDDRDGANDRCSTLDFAIQPGETVFAHVSEFGDNNAITGYLLVIDFPVCGDGSVDPGEECDPPDGVTCSDFCQNIPVCGDGFIETPEEVCDGANLAGEDCISLGFASGTLACAADCATFDTSACVPPICNNGIIEPGEECEDGNTDNGDGCDENCLFEPQPEVEPNGGVIEAINNGAFTPNVMIVGEINPVADKDFFAINVPLPAALRIETFDETGIGNCAAGHDTLVRLFDVNGSTELISDNDDGVGACSLIDPSVDAAARNLAPGTYFVSVEENGNNATIVGYTLVITFDTLCGDGVVQNAEECDPPDGITCDDQCQRIPICGDGFIDFPEQCEDGNTDPGDGCDQNCQIEGAGFSCFAGQTLVLLPSTDTPIPTIDNGVITSTIDVADVGTVARVIVGIDDLVHPFDAAIDLFVISPAGTRVELSTDNGLDDDNYTGTIFDDNCIVVDGPIVDGVAPYTGCFSPEGLLSDLIGEASNGTWTLEVTDDDGFGDVGSLNAWTLGLCIQ